jgi:hypothetical protein
MIVAACELAAVAPAKCGTQQPAWQLPRQQRENPVDRRKLDIAPPRRTHRNEFRRGAPWLLTGA